MKIIQTQLIGGAVCIFAIAFLQSFTLADDYADDDVEFLEVSTLRSLKDLTPEEEALANEARAHIAKTIENNLVRLLAIVSARGDRRPRQEEDDDDVTPNPNVLPQVAQILGAIFTGGLNISRVVDRTFGLVPNIVKNQVGGIVKLLTGENMESSTVAGASTSSSGAQTASGPTPAPTSAPNAQTTNEAVIVEAAIPVSTTKTPEPETETPDKLLQLASGELKGKYRVRMRTKASSTTTPRPLEDDEIEKIERELVRVARAYEPYVQEKEPRVLAEVFRNVFSRIDFNMTEITRAVPSIFQGTRQAFTVLENLGILDVNDVLDELDLPALEEEEEE